MTSSAEIRRMFLDFFANQHAHLEVPSASLVPSAYDPSVLLNVAGMQPFKPYFAGLETPPKSRLASCQKCFRTPDIDEVGLTARHNTFFEMLGNFSFGDYFKAEAITMAWQLVTDVYGLDPERLWATVHSGDPSLGLGLDAEARDLWINAGLPAERIVPLGADNFWKAGPTGPCGPCSELYFDRGEAWGCGAPDCHPGCDCDRYLEFYNLVFMQYTRDDAGQLTELPAKNIDTGMGLERITSILQGNVSSYEIDTMLPIIRWAEQRSGRTYDSDQPTTKAMRVLADHGRGMVFLASDGVHPSNEGRGYVLRRIIRRAIEHADRIGMYADRAPGVLADLHTIVVDLYADHYAELAEQRSVVRDILRAEEERFLRTLDKGTAQLAGILDNAAAGDTVSGDDAFQLHDTYGFPIELTEELARERGMRVDRERYEQLMEEQRERARAAGGSGSLPTKQAATFVRSAAPSEFVGYDDLQAATRVTAIERVTGAGAGGDEARADDDRVLLKLAHTPFYAEGGGQVSDAGTVTGEHGQVTVDHVLRYDSDQVVVGRLDGEMAAGDNVTARVDASERRPTESNHTATHLLHAALRDVLGDHVRQAGSLVEPGRLRFDFSHTAALTAEEIARVERIANEHVAAGEAVTWDVVDIDTARERGATMLFGEKYGERVRMLQVGDGSWSLELCGGTHVDNTSRIGTILVTGESSVGANTRRIEALTGSHAIDHLRERARVAEDVARRLGLDVERVAERVDELQRANKRLDKELSALRSGGALDAALASRTQEGPFSVVAWRDDALSGDELLDLADRLKGKLGDGAVVILGSAADGDKVSLVVSAADDAVARGAHAGNIVKVVAGIVGGGGGGRPNMARAGGRDASKLDEALIAGRTAVAKLA